MRFLKKNISLTGLLLLFLSACAQPAKTKAKTDSIAMSDPAKLDTATFGTGCFWCSEAIFSSLRGVEKVTCGYGGGNIAFPTYEQVCTGNTGHAEVVQIIYNRDSISYATLLAAFWKSHDPTTLNRQGADEGTQYRSVIFYHNEQQKELAEKYKKELDDSHAFNDPIVTEISPFKNFYDAEAYHQDFYKNNPNYGYCRVVIVPKLDHFKAVFGDFMKK